MTLVADNTWELIFTTDSSSSSRFKFDICSDWSLNFGDDNNDGIADQSGGDIALRANTTYIVTFNDVTKEYDLQSDGDERVYEHVYFRGA